MREQIKKTGVPNSEADAKATEHYFPNGSFRMPEGEGKPTKPKRVLKSAPVKKTSGYKDVEYSVADVDLTKVVSPIEIFTWVGSMLNAHDVTLKDAPCIEAWNMLVNARKNNMNAQEFFKQWSKIKTANEEDDKFKDDGREQIQLCETILREVSALQIGSQGLN